MSSVEVVALADALAWPITTLVIVIVLRASISKFVRAVSDSLHDRGNSVTIDLFNKLKFNMQLDSAVAESSDVARFKAELTEHPVVAPWMSPIDIIQHSDTNLEQHIRELLCEQLGSDASTNMYELTTRATAHGLIPFDLGATIRRLHLARATAQKQGDRLTVDEATEYAMTAHAVELALSNVSGASHDVAGK